MTEFVFTSPDGQKFRITGPEGATQEQAFAMLQQQLGQKQKPVAQGDWGGLRSRLDAAEKAALDYGPNNEASLAAVRQEAARKEGLAYGKANAASGTGLVGEGVGRAMDRFALGLPRLAEAYMPGFLGGQSDVRGAEAHEFLKAADEGRAAQNPMTATAGNVAGIVGQAAVMPASAAPSLMGRMAVSSGQAGVLSAAESAVSSRGDVGDTLTGAGLGLVGGAVGQGVGEGAIRAGRALVDPLRGLAKSGPAQQQASARVLLAAKRAGIDDATAAAKLAELGPDGFMADILGNYGQSLARSSANLSPDARTILENASKERLGGQTERLVTSLRAAGGRAVGNSVDEINENIALASRPAIRKAYKTAQEAGYDMPRTPFDDLLNSPKVQSAIKQAEAEIKDRVAVYGPNEASQLAVYDAAKKILDRMGWKEGDDIAKALAAKLRNAVDDNIPEYGGARQLAQGVKKQQEAVELGASIAGRKVDGAQLSAARNNPLQGSVAQGYSVSKINEIENMKPGQNALDLLTGTRRSRDAMAAALGAKSDDMAKAVAAERQFLAFDRGLTGNSSTARQLAELGIVSGAGAAGGYLTGFDPMQAGSIAGLAMLGKRGGSKLLEALATRNEAAVAPEVARRLIDRSLPKLTDASGKPITETARRALVEALMMTGARGAGYSAGQ